MALDIEFISDDVIELYLQNFHTMTMCSESAPQNRYVLTILGEYCQNGLRHNHLMPENLP